MLFTRKFLCLFLTILIIETLNIFAHAKSLPQNLNRRKNIKSKIHRSPKDLKNLLQNEPVLYTLPKPIKHLSSSSQSTDNTPRPYMNDVEYDLRLRQLMEELVLRSHFENKQDINTHTPKNSSSSISSENIKYEEPHQDSLNKDSLFDYILQENKAESKQSQTKLANGDSIDAHQIQQQMKKLQHVQERTKIQFNETKHIFENFLNTNLSHKMNTPDERYEKFELSATNHTNYGDENKGVLHQIDFIQQSNNSQPNTTKTTTKIPDPFYYLMKTKYSNASGEQLGTSQNYLASINLEKLKENDTAEIEKIKRTHEMQRPKPLNMFDDDLHLFTNSPYTISSPKQSPTEKISINIETTTVHPELNITKPTSKINDGKEEVLNSTSDLKNVIQLTKQEMEEYLIATTPYLPPSIKEKYLFLGIDHQHESNKTETKAKTDEQKAAHTSITNLSHVQKPSHFDIKENLKPLFATENSSLTENYDIPRETLIPDIKTGIPESITVFGKSESENLANLEQQIEHLTDHETAATPVHTLIFQSSSIENKYENENKILTSKVTHGDITFDFTDSTTTQAPDLPTLTKTITENYWNHFTTEFPQNTNNFPTEVFLDDIVQETLDSNDIDHTDAPFRNDTLIFDSAVDINKNKELIESNLNKTSTNQIRTAPSPNKKTDETIHESNFNRYQNTVKPIEPGQFMASQLSASTSVLPSHFTPIELKPYRFITNSMDYVTFTTESPQHSIQLPINDTPTSSMTTVQQRITTDTPNYSATDISPESAFSPQEVKTSTYTKMQIISKDFTKGENLKIYDSGFPKLSENSMTHSGTENNQVLNTTNTNPDKSIADFPPTIFTTHYNDSSLKKSSHMKVGNISNTTLDPNSKDETLRWEYKQTSNINREKNENFELKYENMPSSQVIEGNFGAAKIMDINETKLAAPLENRNNENTIEKFTEIPEPNKKFYSMNVDNDLDNNNDRVFSGQVEKYSKLSQEHISNKFLKPLLEPSISNHSDNKSSQNKINSYSKFPKIKDTDKVSSSIEDAHATKKIANLISTFNGDNLTFSEPSYATGFNINLIPQESPNAKLQNTTSTSFVDALKDVKATNQNNEYLKTQTTINSEKEESGKNDFNSPTLAEIKKSVVWLTQSSSSYQKPSIIIENEHSKPIITGSLHSISNDLFKTGNVKILKPEEKSENLNELISIIGNSLPETTKTNKHLQQNKHEIDNSNDDNINNRKQNIQEEVSSTVNCHTATTSNPDQYSLSSAMTIEIRTEEDVEETGTNVDNRSAVIEKTIENDKKNIKKWATFKNNQLNNDSITKSGNLFAKKNANADDDDGPDTDSDEEVDFNVNTVEVNGSDKATYTTSPFIKDMRLEMKVENKGIGNGKIDKDIDNDRVVETRNNYTGPIILQQKGHGTSNEFIVSQTEGGINEMSTIENKLLSISKHKSKFMPKTSTNPYDQQEMVNNKKTKNNNQNKGNQVINENISNNSNSISLIKKSNRDDEIDDDADFENIEEFEGPNDKNIRIFDNLLKTQSFPATTDIFHSNSSVNNIRTSTSKNIPETTQTKEEITMTNWWHSLPYAEIRKFLNYIFDRVTSSDDDSLNKSAYSPLSTMKIPKTTSTATTEEPASTSTKTRIHETIKQRKPKKEQWPIGILNNIWSSLVMITRIFVS